MVATTRLQRWMAPKVEAGRTADTQRFIGADPTEVAVVRDGATLPGTLTVRIVPLAMRGQESRSPESASLTGPLTVTAAAGTDLRVEDRLIVPGGVVYRIGFVPPGQRWRIEAAAEVLA